MNKPAVVGAALLLVTGAFVAGRYSDKSNHQTSHASARRIAYYVDPMHPSYHSDKPGIAPDCGMQLEPVYADDAGSGPQTVSMTLPAGDVGIDGATQQLLGIRVATVEKSSGPQSARLVGRVVPEDTRVYRVNSGTDGFVRETYNDSVGELVKKDQKLASSYTGETLAVASGFLAASAGVPGANGKDGSRTVPFPGALSKQGSSSLQGYTDRLRNLGVSDAQIKQMAESRQLPESVDIVAPADGFIIARNISAGQHFEHDMEFYRIADLSKVWILADIIGNEAQNFHPGSVARVSLPSQGKTFTAHVSDFLPQVDPATRTLKLRLEVDNPQFALRPDMYVDVELPVAMPSGLTVPQDAVIDSGHEKRVFVERSSGVFEPRQVQTGWRYGDRVEIVHGVKEGERVVAAGTFLVDSESRLKSVGQTPMQESREKGIAPAKKDGALVTATGKVKDAACGMMIDAAQAAAQGNTVTRDGVTYYFCSKSCKKKFDAQPERYLAQDQSGPRS
jgi:RND family efflux transporter MFP subunit